MPRQMQSHYLTRASRVIGPVQDDSSPAWRDRRHGACVPTASHRGRVRPRSVVLSLIIGMVLTGPADALDVVRRHVIDEACPVLARDEPGPNGVMAPREVRCRLAMGESYDEIDADIRARQQAEAEHQIEARTALRSAREHAAHDRLSAQMDAVALCNAMVQEHEAGRWFISQATAPRLLNVGNAHGHPIDPAVLERTTAFMDGLGHNYAEPDQRALVLRGVPPDGTLSFWQLNPVLDTVAANIAARASAAEFDATADQRAGGARDPASAEDYAFRCFVQRRLGSLEADPFDRAERLDASGHYVGTR